MPGKSCFATVLALASLVGQTSAQEFVSESFGAEAAAAVSSASPAPSPSGVLARGDEPPSSPNDLPGLVLPAILETPDRYVPSVHPTSHTEPLGDRRSDENPDSPVTQSKNSTESSGHLPSAANTKHHVGFPDLAPPARPNSGGVAETPAVNGLGAALTVISSLAVVLGLFFTTAWILRRTGGRGLALLPGDVFESLGRAPLTNRQQVQLLRCGSKLLLVSLTPDSAETLTEIDDPDEVTRLAGLCKANQAGSATAAFRQVLHQFAKEPVEPGFVGPVNLAVSRDRLPSGLEDLHG